MSAFQLTLQQVWLKIDDFSNILCAGVTFSHVNFILCVDFFFFISANVVVLDEECAFCLLPPLSQDIILF